MPMREWESPNGVSHLVDDATNLCMTCGRRHEPSDEVAVITARGILDEAEGDLDEAIKIANKIVQMLESMNKPPEIRFELYDNAATFRSMRGYMYDIDIPRFGFDGYWTDGR